MSKSKPRKHVKKPFKVIDYEKVENLAGRGMTKNDIALCLGICPATLYNRQKDDKKFTKAMEKGQAMAIAAVTGELFKHIRLGSMTGIIFYLKCRAGWKETQVLETKDMNMIDVTPDAPPQEASDAYFNAVRGL